MDPNEIAEAVDAYLGSLDADDEDTLRIIVTDLLDRKRFVRAVPLTLNGVRMDDEGQPEAIRFVVALRQMARANSAGWKALKIYLDTSSEGSV
jgi:hypothetical protein